MFINWFRGLIGFCAVKVAIVAKRLEATNGIGPEAELFTFSKMAAGMYLEHYLDSKIVILWGKVCRENNDCPHHQAPFACSVFFPARWVHADEFAPAVSQYSAGLGAGYLLGCRVP